MRLILNVWPQYKLEPGEISHYGFVKWLVVQNIPNIGKSISTLLTQPANLSMHTQLHTQHHTLIRVSFMLRHTAESMRISFPLSLGVIMTSLLSLYAVSSLNGLGRKYLLHSGSSAKISFTIYTLDGNTDSRTGHSRVSSWKGVKQ